LRKEEVEIANYLNTRYRQFKKGWAKYRAARLLNHNKKGLY